MTDQESQAGSPPVVVPNSTEQSLRDRFEQILLISEVAAASLQGTTGQNRTKQTKAQKQAKQTKKTKPYLQNRQLISACGSRAGQRMQEEGKYML